MGVEIASFKIKSAQVISQTLSNASESFPQVHFKSMDLSPLCKLVMGFEVSEAFFPHVAGFEGLVWFFFLRPGLTKPLLILDRFPQEGHEKSQNLVLPNT